MEGNDFASLLKKEFKPKTEEAKSAVEAAVQTLAAQALANTQIIASDAVKTIEGMIAALDKKLTDQVNRIIHHKDFQKLESAWRGLHYLVNNTETDEQLKIRVMNVSKADLGKTLKRFKGTAWDQSPLFKKLYEEEYGQFGGEPYGCLVGDYHFDHTPPDVELLSEMSKVAAAGARALRHRIVAVDHADGVVAGARQPARPDKIFTTPEYAAWRSLRESDDARYLAMCMPRFLARLPYGPRPARSTSSTSRKTPPTPTTRSTAGRMRPTRWRSTSTARSSSTAGARASAASSRAARSRTCRPTPSRRTTAASTRSARPRSRSPTGARPSCRRTASSAMIHRKNSDFAAFISGQSLQKPQEYDDPDATANAALAARLPYLFACNRFAHYLKCIVRDKIGSFRSRESMENWLNEWILNYVDGDPTNSSEEVKARRPLAAASVEVEEVEGQPGYYQSRFFLKPHYQLEGLTVSLRLVSKLPSEKSA
jgi:type VI secretion system protein ImpC